MFAGPLCGLYTLSLATGEERSVLSGGSLKKQLPAEFVSAEPSCYSGESARWVSIGFIQGATGRGFAEFLVVSIWI